MELPPRPARRVERAPRPAGGPGAPSLPRARRAGGDRRAAGLPPVHGVARRAGPGRGGALLARRACRVPRPDAAGSLAGARSRRGTDDGRRAEGGRGAADGGRGGDHRAAEEIRTPARLDLEHARAGGLGGLVEPLQRRAGRALRGDGVGPRRLDPRGGTGHRPLHQHHPAPPAGRPGPGNPGVVEGAAGAAGGAAPVRAQPAVARAEVERGRRRAASLRDPPGLPELPGRPLSRGARDRPQGEEPRDPGQDELPARGPGGGIRPPPLRPPRLRHGPSPSGGRRPDQGAPGPDPRRIRRRADLPGSARSVS